DRVIDVHLRGTAYVTHAAWPHLRDQSYGRVVFTTSSSGLWGNFGQANYDAAKLGIVGLMQALKLEGASRGVRVNTVAPFASTSMGADFLAGAIKSGLQPEHVASLVAYLSSEGCEPNGEIFEVGARRIRRVRMLASEGVINDRDHSVEAIAAVMKHVLAAPLTLGYTSVEAALADFVSHFGVASREIS